MKASDNVFPKVLIAEGSAPATPSSGEVVMYAKADGLLYSKDDAGTETQLGAGGGGGSGDVTGPSSSTNGHIAVFDGSTGKLLKDGGALASVATSGDVDDLTGFPGGTTDFLRADGTFAAPPGAGSVSWGGITGTLSDQTDLQSALDAKLGDAPSDGTGYVRKDGAWAAESGGGGSDVLDVSTPSNVSGTVTLDFAGKTRYVGAITLGANVTTLAFSNLPGAGKYAEYELHIKQDPTTPRTFAIPASHKALGGSDTGISASVGVTTVLTGSTIDNGTTWRYAMQESA